MPTQCVGIIGKGSRCIRNAPADVGRCATHQRPIVEQGPGQTALDDLIHIMKNTKGAIADNIMLQVAIAEVAHFPNAQNFGGEWHNFTPEQRQAYNRQSQIMWQVADRISRAAANWHMARINALEEEFRNAPPLTPVNLTHLIEEVQEQVRVWSRTALNEIRVGRRFAAMFGDEPLPAPPPRRVIDPAVLEGDRVRRAQEAAARQARRIERARVAVEAAREAAEAVREAQNAPLHPDEFELLVNRAQLMENNANHRIRIARANARVPAAAGPVAPAAPAGPPPRGELEVFARDRQNVHTTQSVQMTKDIVARVLKIAVPEEYKWNTRTVSKTPGEIIIECRLRPNSVAQFISRYIASENIYEMGVGIFGKVLDSVWQYVRNSEHKEDLCKILAQELRDNEGMCLQGNLTRLCNVLAGYLEGVGPQESPAERLGRELPKLMEIEDSGVRMDTARGVLRDVGMPEAEWAPWLEALE